MGRPCDFHMGLSWVVPWDFHWTSLLIVLPWRFHGIYMALPWDSRGTPVGIPWFSPWDTHEMTTNGAPACPLKRPIMCIPRPCPPIPLVASWPSDQVDMQPDSLGAPAEEVLQVLRREIPPTVSYLPVQKKPPPLQEKMVPLSNYCTFRRRSLFRSIDVRRPVAQLRIPTGHLQKSPEERCTTTSSGAIV